MTRGAGSVGGSDGLIKVQPDPADGIDVRGALPAVETPGAPVDNFENVQASALGEAKDMRPEALIQGIMTFLGRQADGIVDLVDILYRTSMWNGFLSPQAFSMSAPPQGEGAAGFSKWLGEVGNFVDGAVKRFGKSPRYIVYPAAGADAASVTAAFPEADGYVFLSQNAFIAFKGDQPAIDPKVFDVSEADLRFQFNRVKQTGAVSVASGSAGGILPLLLSNLKFANPDMELTGVVFFAGTPEPPYRSAPHMASKSHGIIFFRPRPDAEMKMIVYMQTPLNEYSRPAVSVPDLYEATPVGISFEFMEGLFIKGSQGAMCPIRDMKAERAVHATSEELLRQNPGRDEFLRILERRSGVIVAGVHAHHAFSEPGLAIPCCEVFPEEVYKVSSATPDKGWKLVAQDPKFTLSYLPGIKFWGHEGTEAAVPQPVDILGVDALLGGGTAKVDHVAAVGGLFRTNVLTARPDKPVALELDPRIDRAQASMEAFRARAERAYKK